MEQSGPSIPDTLSLGKQAVLVFYIFGKETKVVNDISGYHADNPNAVVHVGDA